MQTFLLASFPHLSFEAAPPLSFEEFLLTCKQHLSTADFTELKAVCTHPDKGNSSFAKSWTKTKTQWQTFNQRERKKRLSNEKTEPVTMENDLLRIQIEQAWQSPDPLSRERALLQSLWNWIENRRRTSPFSLTDLFGYGVQLQLSERTSMWNESAGQTHFQEHTQTFLEPVIEELRKQELSV